MVSLLGAVGQTPHCWCHFKATEELLLMDITWLRHIITYNVSGVAIQSYWAQCAL